MAENRKAARIVFRCLAFGGIVVLGIAAAMLLQTLALVIRGERAEGTVIDIVWKNNTDADSTGSAKVHFQADGRTVEFTSFVGMKPPLHKVHDRVTVFYWPDKPENAVICNFLELYLQPIVAGGMGLILLAIGGGFLWGPAWFARRRQRVILDGLPVQARVVAVRIDRSVTVNDQSPWIIVAVFKDDVSGQPIECTSHYLWADPTPQYPVGCEVTIYYLQGQPQKHAFQLDKLPETSE